MVDVEMENVEFVGLGHRPCRASSCNAEWDRAPSVSRRSATAEHDTRFASSDRVAAREQGDIVALGDEILGKVGNDALGPAI